MFSNFIRFDLKNGLLKAWKKYVIAIFVFSCFFSFHFFRVYAQNIHLQKSGETPLRFTCGDLLLSVLDGRNFTMKTESLSYFQLCGYLYFCSYYILHYAIPQKI